MIRYCLTSLLIAICLQAGAQQVPDIAALKGLSPVTELSKSEAGKAALTANYKITGGIERGDIHQPTLLPFTLQEEQALQDAFSTGANLEQLADGLGSTLGAAYSARFHYIDQQHVSKMPETLSNLIRYAGGIAGPDSNRGKFLFANKTLNGKDPVPADVAAILTEHGGETDPFGRAYHLPAGSPGADPYGDSRPFQTEHDFRKYDGVDYLYRPSDNSAYTFGPAMDLVKSPSYPSGHTTYGYTGALLLAILVPERYSQMITRGAEYGNDRIIIGAHYAMDVLGGRALALYDMAHLLANDPAYMKRTVNGAIPISDFQAAMKQARNVLLPILQSACGDTIAACAQQDRSRFSRPAANEAFYLATQTYDLGVVHPNIQKPEDVSQIAPEAGYLLTQAFPSLTLEQADRILTETEGPGGGFLDNGSAFGVYSRLNLYAAGRKASEMSAQASATK